MEKFLKRLLFFSLPVVIIFLSCEYFLRQIPYSTSIKENFFEQNSEQIKILSLGSSHYERGINPQFLNYPTLNLGNSGQRINENYNLLIEFAPKLPNLKLVMVELGYDWLERDKSYTSPIVDILNLHYYDTNTFQRNVTIKDYSFYLTDPEYFSQRIINHFSKKTNLNYNQYGFETDRYYGSYEAVQNIDSLIIPEDIFIDNASDKTEFKINSAVLFKFLEYCRIKDLEVLVFNPPTHYKYNQLREKEIINRRDNILKEVLKRFPDLKVFNLEEDEQFNAKDFYNGDHLNPSGAEKATKMLNSYLKLHYDL